MTDTLPADWTIQPDGTITHHREAQAWKANPDGTLDCHACYRHCVLAEGQDGPCGHRGNRDGTLVLHDHGTLSALVRQINGYGPDPFLTYKPGQPSLMVGGLRCTAGCTFCMSGPIVHRPTTIPAADPVQHPIAAPDSLFYSHRIPMRPHDVVVAAILRGARSILFGINEPTLTFEYTLDVARIAKTAGLDVRIETNGFATPDVITALAPFVDAVDVGTKGSADPEFYARRMAAPGAVPTVLASLEEWRRHGIHVIVGDLIAPPAWQDEASFEGAAQTFYRHVFDRLGPCTDVVTTQIHVPGPMRPGRGQAPPITTGGNPEAACAYQGRIDCAVDMAHDEGLVFAHAKGADQLIPCPKCGTALLRFRAGTGLCQRVETEGSCLMAEHFCAAFGHDQNVTQDSRCASCGEPAPIIVMPDIQHAQTAEYLRRQAAQGSISADVRAELEKQGWL